MPKSRAAFSRLPHLCGTIGQSELRARFGTVCTDSDTAWIMFKEVLRECPSKFEAKPKRFQPDRTDCIPIGQASRALTAAQISPSEMGAREVSGTSHTHKLTVWTPKTIS